jgi:hypothetical protein
MVETTECDVHNNTERKRRYHRRKVVWQSLKSRKSQRRNQRNEVNVRLGSFHRYHTPSNRGPVSWTMWVLSCNRRPAYLRVVRIRMSLSF